MLVVTVICKGIPNVFLCHSVGDSFIGLLQGRTVFLFHRVILPLISNDLTATEIMRRQIIDEEKQLLFLIPVRDTKIIFVMKTEWNF